MSEEDTLSQAELQRRLDLAHAEAEAQIQAAKAEKARLEALAAEAAALRRQKELVRSAAIGRRAQVSILMSEGAVPNYIFQGRTALSAAAEGGHLTTVLALLKAGSSYDIENQNNSLPPIVAAASEGYTEVVRALLDHGENPNKASSAGGMTALIFASSRGYTETMRLLIDRGASVDQRDDIACTALMRAAAEGKAESVKVLVEYGKSDWTLNAMGGLNPLTWARSKGHTDVVTLLEHYTALWASSPSVHEFYATFAPEDASGSW